LRGPAGRALGRRALGWCGGKRRPVARRRHHHRDSSGTPRPPFQGTDRSVGFRGVILAVAGEMTNAGAGRGGDEGETAGGAGRTDAGGGGRLVKADQSPVADRAVGVVTGRARGSLLVDVLPVLRKHRAVEQRCAIVTSVAERVGGRGLGTAVGRGIGGAEQRPDG